MTPDFAKMPTVGREVHGQTIEASRPISPSIRLRKSVCRRDAG